MSSLPKRFSFISVCLFFFVSPVHSQDYEYSELIYYYTGASFSVSLDPVETAIRRCELYGGFDSMRPPPNGASNHGYPNYLVACNNYHAPNEIFVSTTCETGWTKTSEHCRRRNTTTNPATDAGPPSCSAGNPINLANGRKYQVESDYQSSANPLLQFVRYYNSFQSVVNRPGEPARLASDNVASSWTHSYSNYIRIQSDPVNVGTHYLTVLRPSGDIEQFTQVGTSITRRADNGGTDRLTFDNGVYTYIVNALTTETYDGNGRFLKRVQGRYEVSADYDANGQLVGVSTPEGHALSFVISPNTLLVDIGEPDLVEHNTPLLSAVVLPDGTQISFEQDQSANGADRLSLTKVIYPDASERGYNYTGGYRRLLASIEDEKGVVFAEWTYDVNGKALSSKHANNVDTYSFSYDGTDVSVTNPLGLTTTYETQFVAGKGRLVSTDQEATALCAAADRQYTYDTQGNRLSKTDWNGNTTLYGYNSDNQRISVTEASGTAMARQTTMQWHPVFNLPTEVVYPHKTVSTSYDAVGNVTQRTETDASSGESRTWSYQYDTSYRLISEDGPRTDVNDVTTYTYYNCSSGERCGQVATVTNGLGQTTTYSDYNDHGQPTAILDANGVSTTITYDLRQRVTAVSTAGATQSLTYDATGNITRIEQADGSALHYGWDDANRLIALYDAQNNRIDWSLDAAGNRVSETIKDPSGALKKSQSRTFDELSRLRTILMNHGGQTQFEYDKNSNLVSETDADSRQTTYQIDALDRVLVTTDAANGQTQFSYDTQDNITSVTDPEGKTTNYTYNGYGDQLTVDSPDTGVTTSTYDAAGNRISSTDARGITASYTYDALNRLTGITYPNSAENITYTYDTAINGVGRLSRIDDQTGSVEFNYDARGNVTEVVQTTAGNIYTTGYQYNAADRLTGITLPSGRQVSYNYDASARVSGVTSTFEGISETLASGITRLPFGPSMSMTLGNGIATTKTYDLDYRLSDLTHGSVLQRNYAYNAVNNITAITDSLNADQSQLFTYDSLDRLAFATGGYGEQSYTYDGIGNRLSLETTVDGNTNTQSYQYDTNSHRLTAIAGERSFSYDAVGNTLNNGNATFTYNERNRMSSATANGVTTTYGLNAMGQRVSKSNSNGETHYIYDLSGQLIAEANATGTIEVEYTYLDGEPLAMWRDDDANSAPSGENLLSNAGFESGTNSWFSCSDNGTTTTSSDSTEGTAALEISGADCLYQEFPISPDTTYTVQCDAKATGYASIAITAMDANYSSLGAEQLTINGNSYQSVSTSIDAPAGSAIGAVTFYSEGTAHIDRCSVIASGGNVPPEPPVADSLLSNGGFESGTSDWFSCSNSGTTTTSSNASEGSAALEISGSDCLYQEFPITPDTTYTLQCDAMATGYASISLTVMDASYSSLGSEQLTIDSGTYQTLSTSITAPINAAIGAVTVYSEGTANIDACTVIESGSTPPDPEPPIGNSLLTNGGFESGTSDWFSCSNSGSTTTNGDATEGSSALEISGSDCLYQEFSISPNTSYTVQCDAKATGYASISLTAMDSNYSSVGSEQLTISASSYQTISTSLTAPTGSAIGAVTFYSEGTANIDACTVVEGQ